MRTGVLSARNRWSPRVRIFAMFFLYSLALGGIFPRLGDLQLSMGIGEGALGAALVGMAFGTQIAFMFVGPLLLRFGHRAALLVCIPFLALFETIATLSPTPLVLFTLLAICGLAVGTIELVINLEADRTEHLMGRRLMNRAHAFWSLGFFFAGMVGAGLKQANVSAFMHLCVMGILVSAAVFMLLGKYRQAPPRPEHGVPAPRFVRPTRGILAIVGFTLSAMMMEGASIDWSVIYMRDVFGTAPFINGLAFAIGALAMALTRFFADGYIDRYGAGSVARLLVLVLGAGVVLVTFASHPVLAILGFAFIGMGGSVMFPLAISAAAQMTDRPAATNVAALAQLSFITFLVAPPILGFVAQNFGIRVSFGLGLPMVVLSWFLLFTLAPQKAKMGGSQPKKRSHNECA
ncbi:MAG TPA: MFS transporter [Devosia sp.]|nr:MFS transporter [Devosia sp.]